MKTIVLMLSFLSLNPLSFSQLSDELTTRNWVKVIEENVNDTVILYGEDVSDLYMKLVFRKKDTLTLYGNPDGGVEFQYKLSDSLLKLSNGGDYFINSINDSILILQQGYNDSEIFNRRQLVFMEENYLFNKLLKSNEIGLFSESLVAANKMIYPIFKVASFYMFLNWYIPPYKAEDEHGILTFRIIFNSEGHLEECKIINNESISKSFAEKVRKLVARTDGFWEMPLIGDKYSCEMVMCIWFPRKEESILQQAYPFYFDKDCSPVPKSQSENIKKHLDKGLSLIQDGKYENSIEEFNTCLNFSSRNPENIYYNRAFAYYRLNKMDEACSDWSLLISKGQRYAKKLYTTFCK